MRRHIGRALACIFAAGIAACGSDNPVDPPGGQPDSLFKVNVKLLNGPTNTAPGAYDGDRTRGVMVTPNTLSVTITGVALGHAGTNEVAQSQTECTATFSRYTATKAEIGSCVPTFPAGSYDVVYVTLSRRVKVLLADTAAAYFTGPLGSGPAPGTVLDTITSSGVGMKDADTTFAFVLPTKLVVDAQTSPTLALVVDANHSILATNGSGGSHLTIGRPLILATVGIPTAMEYYVRSPLRGVAAYCVADCPVPRALNGFTVVYTGTNTPAAIALHYFQIIECPFATKAMIMTDPRSYMGIDPATSELTWALSANDSWTTYAGLLQIKRLTTLGTSATLWCVNRSSVTAPSGGAFTTAPTDFRTTSNDRGTFTLAAK